MPLQRRNLLATTLAALAPIGTAAQTVSMAGSIGDSKALLMINGARHTLAVGSNVKGVTLKRVMPGQAEIEIGEIIDADQRRIVSGSSYYPAQWRCRRLRNLYAAFLL